MILIVVISATRCNFNLSIESQRHLRFIYSLLLVARSMWREVIFNPVVSRLWLLDRAHPHIALRVVHQCYWLLDFIQSSACSAARDRILSWTDC